MVLLRTDIVGTALEDGGAGRRLGHRGHELDGTGSGTDHGDPLAGQVDGVVPTGRVPRGPGKGADALDVGDVGPVELTAGEDHGVGLELLVARRGVEGEPPGAGGLVVARRAHGRAGTEVGSQVVAVDEVLGVREDLGLFGEPARPVRLRCEREGVEMGGDVACRARVDVVPPGATHAVGLLDDGEAAYTGPDQLDGGGQAGQPTAHDGHGGRRASLDPGAPDLPIERLVTDVECHDSPSPVMSDTAAMWVDDTGSPSGCRWPVTAAGRQVTGGSRRACGRRTDGRPGRVVAVQIL